MTLQRRTILFIGTCMIAQLVVLSFVAYIIQGHIFNRLEKRFIERSVAELQLSIQEELQRLNREAIDYQNWDESYDFVAHPANTFVEANFQPDSMRNIKVDVALFHDDDGKIVMSRALNADGTVTTVPQSVVGLVRRDIPTAIDKCPEPIHLNVARLPEGILLYSVRPFYHNDGSGPARGTGLLGKWFTPELLKSYETAVAMTLEMNKGKLADDPSGGIALFPFDRPFDFSADASQIEHGKISVLLTFLDADKHPVLQLTASREPVVNKMGAISTTILIGVIILLGLVMAGLVMLLINKIVLKRIAALAAHVREIGASGDTSRQIEIDSKDEMGKLGADINLLLSKLHESETILVNKDKQLELMLDQSPLAITISDKSGRILMMNQKYTEFSGYTKEELGTLDRLKEHIFPDESYRQKINDKLAENVRIAREKGTRPEPVEYSVTNKNGVTIDVEMFMAEAGGLIFRIVNDVTQRNRIMAEQKKATEAANAANEAKSLFLANMSHEIRTPLNGITGMAQILAETDLSATQRNCVETIGESCDLLVSVINDILDIAKVEAGKLCLHPEPVETRAFANSVCALAGPNILINGLEFLTEFDDSVPAFVVCDPKRLQQVLINLLSNAAKFTDRGHVLLHIGGSGCVGGKTKLLFEVRDTGIGIAPDDIKRIFEPFVQADSSHTRMRGGTGLGLTICLKLVQLMGGDVRVASEPGKGSTFSFEIEVPVIDSLPVKTASENRIDVGLGKRCPLKILVAEDNLVNQKVVGMILKKMGYKPDFAFNGGEALEKEKKNRYDVILMDVQMPVMDGLAATSEIRRCVPGDDQPVIIALTAHALGEDSAKCKDAGMDEHLTKPLNATTLGNSLAKVYQGMIARKKA
jgi:PAS domain S-box-containing protein